MNKKSKYHKFVIQFFINIIIKNFGTAKFYQPLLFYFIVIKPPCYILKTFNKYKKMLIIFYDG